MAIMGKPSTPAGVAMLKALGLPVDRCLSLDIGFHPDSVVEVTVRYAPDEGQLEDVVQAMRGYMLALSPANHDG